MLSCSSMPVAKRKAKKPKRDPVSGRWVRVVAPEVWRPNEGEELIGHYGGVTKRNGPHGEYSLAIVHAARRAFLISGFDLLNKIGAADFAPGEAIRIVFCGYRHTNNGHDMKIFDVFYDADARPMDGDLPYLREVQR